jgi:hypothetical protein
MGFWNSPVRSFLDKFDLDDESYKVISLFDAEPVSSTVS